MTIHYGPGVPVAAPTRRSTRIIDRIADAGAWLSSAMCGLCLAVLMASSEIAPPKPTSDIYAVTVAPWPVVGIAAVIVGVRLAYLAGRYLIRTRRAAR